MIKVLIVDDSALMRQMLTEMLSSDPDIDVVAAAEDPYQARELIKQTHPDVITLDVEMPKMDGVTFLKNLMRLHPLPVLMISSLTEEGADVTLRALEYGAVDFITKPKAHLEDVFQDYRDDVINKVKVASKVSSLHLEHTYQRKLELEYRQKQTAKTNQVTAHFKTTEKVIAIGASTGGTEAIKEIVTQFDANMPGIVIAQHIPAAFSASFAERLNTLTNMVCKEAQNGEEITTGRLFVAPGGKHLRVVRDGARYICRVTDDEPVNRHKPSVDVLFDSIHDNVGHQNAIGIMLTGMGSDGAKGMLRMHNANVLTVAQNEESSVVWGMPGSAVKLNAVDEVLPLNQIAQRVVRWVKESS